MYNINDDYKFSLSCKASSWPRDEDTCDEVIDDSATEKMDSNNELGDN